MFMLVRNEIVAIYGERLVVLGDSSEMAPHSLLATENRRKPDQHHLTVG